MKKYTIEEFKSYLLSQNTLSNIYLNLNEVNMDKLINKKVINVNQITLEQMINDVETNKTKSDE